MSKSVITLVAAVLLSATALSAQEPKVEEKAAATAAKTEQARPPEPPAQAVNIRIEVVITDQLGPGEASKKTVSMIVGDRQQNSIRTSAQVRPNPNSSNTRQVGINLLEQCVCNQVMDHGDLRIRLQCFFVKRDPLCSCPCLDSYHAAIGERGSKVWV